jgi:hypothetical protein
MSVWLEILLVTGAFLVWVASLFVLVLDSISVGAKVLWFVAMTVAAPFAIPVYLGLRLLRHRRGAVEPAV